MHTTYMNDPLLSAAIFLMAIFFFILITAALCEPRKSQKYRKLLTDLFVAGKIRKLSKKEDIDLAEEEKVFNLWTKKRRLAEGDLDRAIELEMKDKIADEGVETSKQ